MSVKTKADIVLIVSNTLHFSFTLVVLFVSKVVFLVSLTQKHVTNKFLFYLLKYWVFLLPFEIVQFRPPKTFQIVQFGQSKTFQIVQFMEKTLA